ncbi:DUF2254 family protein [Methanolobus mangrovi]|uniref:DUF2254 family protein n=1 Tax=Methanolobus mangrovi TaxID=3072977 RepID=A0AA51UDY2_9EURY|nr:DUF2254 family protein [Methanolobus mangrovi]WMW21449.1 DUF2254 family protein [Methanolobus mangrovi]
MSVSYVFLAKVWAFETNADSARYMISALVQSEAAIIAIVITLSLVAIQHVAAYYSERTIDLFKSFKTNPDFIILLFIYFSSIIYGLWVLKTIHNSQSFGVISHNFLFFGQYNDESVFENKVIAAYSLGIFAFFALIIYINRILEMFKPTEMIKLFSTDVGYYNIKNALEKEKNIDVGGEVEPVIDTVQPIVDVLRGSIKKHDYESVKYGLNVFKKKAISIIENKENQYLESTFKVVDHIIFHIGELVIDAAKKDMEDAAIFAVNIISDIGIAAATKNLRKITDTSIMKICFFCSTPLKTSFGDFIIVHRSVVKVAELTRISVDNKWETEIGHGILALSKTGYKLVDDEPFSHEVKTIVEAILMFLIQLAGKLSDDESMNSFSINIVTYSYKIGEKILDTNNLSKKEKLDSLNDIMAKLDSLSTHVGGVCNGPLYLEIRTCIFNLESLKSTFEGLK